jgi:hypothetical protein
MINEPGQTESKGILTVSKETKEACEALATKLHDARKRHNRPIFKRKTY